MTGRPRAAARLLALVLVAPGRRLRRRTTSRPEAPPTCPARFRAGSGSEEPPGSAPPAPDFSAELVDGTPVTASELWADRPLVLMFTASFCDRCADIHREVAEAVDEHDGAIALLGVVGDDDTEAAEYAEELDLGHPLAVAGERIWLSYAAREPALVALVAQGGKVLRGWPNGVDADELAAELDELVVHE